MHKLKITIPTLREKRRAELRAVSVHRTLTAKFKTTFSRLPDMQRPGK